MSDTVRDPQFKLIERLAEGASGEVWRVKELTLGIDRAMKILLQKHRPDSTVGRMLVREGHLLTQLQYPGICLPAGSGRMQDGRPYLVMQLVKGKTVANELATRGPGADHWLADFERVCRAVGFAHEQGVVHCDLEPTNVMVGADGEVVVIDWGLVKLLPGAKVTSDDADAGYVTLTDGTPEFMSPELARGTWWDMDRRSDVFSLGALLCLLLTGLPPYTGKTLADVRMMSVHAELDAAFDRLGGCGANRVLIELCKRCLSADPAVRPSDAGEVAAAVAEVRGRG